MKHNHRMRKRQGMSVVFDSPRRSAPAKIKAEVIRLGNNGTHEGFKFADRMVKALPELRNV